MAEITCLTFKPHVSGSLRGFADLHYRSARLKLIGCTVHESHGSRWVELPGKAQLDRERRLVTDDRGKIQYVLVITWDNDQVRRAFSKAAVAAVLTYAPWAFDRQVAFDGRRGA
ncbi:hypothetical protein [Microvirga massiliensis]|uniref:hypothetical protein n=1 Tax=Microvirga massiliensis TaxID=1033741 RepID=UPI00062B9121|nr:hypothetical protein [Microvirga massiliensis]